MNRKTEDQLRETIKGQLNKAFHQGIMSGTKAVCSVVHEFAVDPSLDDAQARQKIMEFCAKPLSAKAETPDGR